MLDVLSAISVDNNVLVSEISRQQLFSLFNRVGAFWHWIHQPSLYPRAAVVLGCGLGAHFTGVICSCMQCCQIKEVQHSSPLLSSIREGDSQSTYIQIGRGLQSLVHLLIFHS